MKSFVRSSKFLIFLKNDSNSLPNVQKAIHFHSVNNSAFVYLALGPQANQVCINSHIKYLAVKFWFIS